MPDIDFDKIVLSKSELQALKILETKNLLLESESKEELNRLIRLGLSIRYQTRWNNTPCYGVKISDLGKDYLMYIKRHRKESRAEAYRYWITTIIAAAALVKSFLPEISAGLEVLRKLLVQQ